MMGSQCDGPGCARFAAPPPRHPAPPGWWFLVQPAAPREFIDQLFGDKTKAAEPRTFCSLRCLADWAYTAAVVSGPAGGAEPEQETGTGWPT
jgi:hypothetical protein